MIIRGNWSELATRADRRWGATHHYGIGELVEYNDEVYIALGNTVNDLPDEQGSQHWKQLMTQYAKGAQVLAMYKPY